MPVEVNEGPLCAGEGGKRWRIRWVQGKPSVGLQFRLGPRFSLGDPVPSLCHSFLSCLMNGGCATSVMGQDQAHNSRGPVQNKNPGLLFKH